MRTLGRKAGVCLLAGAALSAAGVAPCTDGAAGEKIIAVRNTQTTYCVSDFGWSDTWFKGYVSSYNQQLDVFSGEDSFNMRWTGMTGQGWLSPSMDRGTTVPQAITTQWSVLTAVEYVTPGLETAVQSVIGHNDGLRVTITTTLENAMLTINFRIQNTSASRTFSNLVLSDYFNFHPNGSLHSNNSTRQGTTYYSSTCPETIGPCAGVLITTGNRNLSTYISDGFVYGERAPDRYATGYASRPPTGIQALFTQIGNGTFNMQSGPVGPADSAGGLAYNLGNLTPGNEVEFNFYKGLADIPEPGTWAMLAGGLLLIAVSSKRPASSWTSSSNPKQTVTNRLNG